MLNQRQAHILGLLIRDFIEYPRPIGSSMLVKKHHLSISPATVRNDFALLEENGFIVQPHTSAGRIPTVKGYQYFVRYLLEEQAVAKREAAQLQSLKRQHDHRRIAQEIAHISGHSTAIIESDGRYYISGLSHLFNKPEFADELLRASMGDLFDHFEIIANELFARMGYDVTTMIGESSMPNACSMMGVKITPPRGQPFLVMICGPMRMNYETNRALLNHIQKLYD